MAYDEMELDTIGDKKTALFLIMSDTDSTFNFVIAILQSQLTNLLCDKIIHPALQLAVEDDIIRKNPADGTMKYFQVESEKNMLCQ